MGEEVTCRGDTDALPSVEKDCCGLEYPSPLSEYSWISLCSQPVRQRSESPFPLLDQLSARSSRQLG